ncbi:hypothetical protein Arub01_25260 [Actinomadura rubrobrunea]|uniref:Uncharacterized protein n=1 Tax=Actinomadura rubrobrunea TaxID=115335 RepID=A0A9W6PVA5_9ACTN|nr:hypothetical protein Arub01_25260 [Actinomadura rubrobrunea]
MCFAGEGAFRWTAAVIVKDHRPESISNVAGVTSSAAIIGAQTGVRPSPCAVDLVSASQQVFAPGFL